LIKIIVSVLFLAIALIVGRLVFLSITSKAPDTKLVNGSLRACPQTPNCVSSEEKDGSKGIAPLSFNSTTEKAWQKLRAAIKQTGGVVKRDDYFYLWATYTSTVFRFVDDMEFRLVPEKNIIHVRSGSRVGHSDLGVNRKNVEKLRKQFNSGNTAKK
jgi:uncharacterized protein (DUF1499 family)